jgi:hypothetical protein
LYSRIFSSNRFKRKYQESRQIIVQLKHVTFNIHYEHYKIVVGTPNSSFERRGVCGHAVSDLGCTAFVRNLLVACCYVAVCCSSVTNATSFLWFRNCVPYHISNTMIQPDVRIICLSLSVRSFPSFIRSMVLFQYYVTGHAGNVVFLPHFHIFVENSFAFH